MARIRARKLPVPTRERILDEAERLIAVKGVYGFKLSDIAEPLGVRVPAIYKHYNSRDDVLIEVSRRFIYLLAAQFSGTPGLPPAAALRTALDRFVELMMRHPAYVRLALIDFATPGGGMEYVKLAAGGSFKQNFLGGPLAAMYTRLRRLLQDGVRAGVFRRVSASDFYGLIKASALIRLVYPDDLLLLRSPTKVEIRATSRWLWNIASRHLSPNPGITPAASRVARAHIP